MTRLFSLFLLASILTGCARHNSFYRSNYGWLGNGKGKVRAKFGSGDLITTDERKEQKERVVIYNASLNLQIKVPADTVNSGLAAIAKKYDGYVLSLGSTLSKVRVKSDKLNPALEEASELGKVTSKNIYGEDVTDQYKDLGIRLENAQHARERYLQLLERAENVEAALKVEKELERLNGEIDLLKGQLNRLQHLSTYSTITVYLKEKRKYGVLGYVFVGLYKGVKWLFVRN